jgi:hypothetical protein
LNSNEDIDDRYNNTKPYIRFAYSIPALPYILLHPTNNVVYNPANPMKSSSFSFSMEDVTDANKQYKISYEIKDDQGRVV